MKFTLQRYIKSESELLPIIFFRKNIMKGFLRYNRVFQQAFSDSVFLLL
jgi:hypothetical protein